MRRTPFTPCLLVGLLFLAAVPETALSHAFTVAFVARFTGSEAVRGRRALHGFLLATRERDGHANETSDGHLGGLDSHVVKVDGSGESTAVIDRLHAIDAARPPAFVTGLLPNESTNLASLVSDLPRAVLVDPGRSSGYEAATRRADGLRTMDGESFTVAFQNAYGYAPDAGAMLGYAAARLIDATVRAVRGDLTRREVVAAALEDAARQPW